MSVLRSGMKSAAFILTCLLLAGANHARCAEYQVVAERSTVAFHVRKLIIHRVEGHFERFSAHVTVPDDEEIFEQSTVTATIETASVRTDDRARDHRLRERDFFWCERFPTMDFRSTRIRKTSSDRYIMVGNLTIRDVTLPVSLEVVRLPAREGGRFRATGSVNRFDFGLSFDRGEFDGALRRMIPLIGDEVEIVLDIELRLP